jgi:polysaccharide export outer membrane protein
MNQEISETAALRRISRSSSSEPTILLARVSILVMLAAFIHGCSSANSSPSVNADPQNAPSAQALAANIEKDSADRERLARLLEKRQQQDFASDYPLGPGDVIEVNVAGMDEIKNLSQRVTGEGTISLPFVGVINVNGLTDKSIRAEIRSRLETDYMRNPQVSLFVREFRSRQVAVIGAVQKPGLYSLTGSGDTVLSMISQAGGMTAGFAERILFIPAEAVESDKAKELATALPVRLIKQDPAPLILKDVEPIVINLAAVNRGGNESYLSMPVRPGDVIMIPGSGEVLVQGWVEKPGSYKITPGLTVLGVVAAAGGAMYAADTNAVKLIRTGAQANKTILISDLEAIANGHAPDLPLLEGDVIDVASSGPKAVAYGVYRFFTTIMRVGASVPIPVGR